MGGGGGHCCAPWRSYLLAGPISPDVSLTETFLPTVPYRPNVRTAKGITVTTKAPPPPKSVSLQGQKMGLGALTTAIARKALQNAGSLITSQGRQILSCHGYRT
jgi:hypothetical protein